MDEAAAEGDLSELKEGERCPSDTADNAVRLPAAPEVQEAVRARNKRGDCSDDHVHGADTNGDSHEEHTAPRTVG